MPKPKPFEKESDLCRAFVSAIGEPWTAYAETGGWDILLVRRSDGFQIGVQAKLRLNADVFAQAIEGDHYSVERPGPDCRAVLVPWVDCSSGIGCFGPYIGVTIIRMVGGDKQLRRGETWRRFEPDLPDPGRGNWTERQWFELAPWRRHELPEYVPDVTGGSRSPLQLTEWKIGALKIAVLIERNGHVTRRDFKQVGIDHRRWIAPGFRWLRVQDGRFIPGDCFPDFKAQHPVVFEKVKADMAKWAPAQEELL